MIATLNTPAFAASKTSDQTVSDYTFTKVTFEQEDVDTDGAYASSTFTCPADKPGLYAFSAEVFISASQDIGAIELELYKTPSGGSAASVAATEGTDITGSEALASYFATINHIEPMAAGDAMEVYIRCDVANNADFLVNESNQDTDNRVRFHGFRIAGVS
tara:strand:+ start:24 stop:506 length:483 start_codon:yes stop_codon:yes gene_type:complete